MSVFSHASNSLCFVSPFRFDQLRTSQPVPRVVGIRVHERPQLGRRNPHGEEGRHNIVQQLTVDGPRIREGRDQVG